MRRIPLLVALSLSACSPVETLPDIVDAPRLDMMDAARVDATTMDSGNDASEQDTAIVDVQAIDANVMDASNDTSQLVDVMDVQPGDTGCGVCVVGTARCAAGTGYLERCESVNGCAAWAVLNACPSNASEPQTCSVDGCLRCGPGDAGACPATLCSSDVQCADLGLGRCVSGRCARRGFLACTDSTSCFAWVIGSSGTGCVDRTFRGQPVRTCDGDGVMPCVANAQCPPAFNGNPEWHCNVGTGFCER